MVVKMGSQDYIVEVTHVSKYFKGKQGGIVTAVDDVSFGITKGEIFSIAGESGSGKTTVGRMVAGLISPSKGKVLVEGKPDEKLPDNVRFKITQYIHQDPYGSLDPYSTVYNILSRPLKYLYKMKDKTELNDKVMEMVKLVGLLPDSTNKTIQELSGGERQRVLIGRAFIINPQLIIADEPTTMIDYVHRDEVMLLISNLKARIGLSVILITHDLSVAAKNSDRIAIMNRGKIVEIGSTKAIINEPMHPYTKLLMSVSPEFMISNVGTQKFNEYLPRNSGSTGRPSKGCVYSSNCPLAFDRCFEDDPELKGDESHKVACLLFNS